MNRTMNKKAIVLLSGGLDSTLAVKALCNQGIEVVAVNFTSPFCNCSGRNAGCGHQAVKVAKEFNIPIRVISKGMDYMRMVERPSHGHGSGMNPCIDCRIYMLRKAKDLMAECGASFVATGEVLGQRPMSQRRESLGLIERESGLVGLILRPLSARHLAPTVPELEGVVHREKLLAITGRSRKQQIALADELGIKDYPCPAGGCLLTDQTIAARLRDLFDHQPDYDLADLYLLSIGRHFRISEDLKIILGRNQKENERILALAKQGACVLAPTGFRGPTALLVGMAHNGSEEKIGGVIAAYSREEREIYPIERSIKGQGAAVFTVAEKYPRERCDVLRIGA